MAPRMIRRVIENDGARMEIYTDGGWYLDHSHHSDQPPRVRDFDPPVPSQLPRFRNYHDFTDADAEREAFDAHRYGGASDANLR
jgi:hypothetical protein